MFCFLLKKEIIQLSWDIPKRSTTQLSWDEESIIDRQIVFAITNLDFKFRVNILLI